MYGAQPPLTLYRTWKEDQVTQKMFTNCHQRWLELNENICIEWYNDYDCIKYMRTQGDVLYNCYQTLLPGAFKADLFRLCLLYERGGIYTDGHTMPYVSLREMLKGCSTENMFVSVLDNEQSGSGIHNGFIVASPQHPFIKECIEQIVHNVQTRNYTDHALGITGPKCLARSINQVLDQDPQTNFSVGLNDHGPLSFYLFRIEWGPFQYVYKNDKVIMSKKHCTLSYLWDKLQSNRYKNMWNKKEVFREHTSSS